MTIFRQPISRRKFLASSAATVAAGATQTSIGFSQSPVKPSERITVGVIGLGSRGFNLIDALLNAPDAEIVALCDVDTLHYRDLPWGEGRQYGSTAAQNHINQKQKSQSKLFVTKDFREVCGRDDIDAVVVATPDHWHALCTLEALRSGKDVYCEKPVTHTFHEGQLVYREVEKQNAVFQTGSQQRSSAEFRRAIELVRNGHLGKIKKIEVGLSPGYDVAQGDATVTKPPKNLDYDFWCGPAPVLPYMRARHHRWWRGHRAYGGGVLMDWIGHHNDIAHWALDLDDSGPTKVETTLWEMPQTEIYNTPHQYEIHCEYASGVVNSIASRYPLGTKFIGEDGWLFVTRGKIEASNQDWTKTGLSQETGRLSSTFAHMQNFLDCVKSRKECVAPAETAHRSITPGHLGYVSQELGRPLRWDAANEIVIDDNEANELLHAHEIREQWNG